MDIKIVVAISDNDAYWSTLSVSDDQSLVTVKGGQNRADSVLACLRYIDDNTTRAEDPLILVHDAARPCVEKSDIEKLIHHCRDHQTGAILAAPVAETVKQVSQNRIRSTVDRTHLWLAQTPQAFTLNTLLPALRNAIRSGDSITDEASAVERSGAGVAIVEGKRSNLKITHPEDLQIAEFFLQAKNKHD